MYSKLQNVNMESGFFNSQINKKKVIPPFFSPVCYCLCFEPWRSCPLTSFYSPPRTATQRRRAPSIGGTSRQQTALSGFCVLLSRQLSVWIKGCRGLSLPPRQKICSTMPEPPSVFSVALTASCAFLMNSLGGTFSTRYSFNLFSHCLHADTKFPNRVPFMNIRRKILGNKMNW